MAEVRLEIIQDFDVELSINGGGSVALSVGEPFIDGGGIPYEGEYTIRPQPRAEVVLPTANRRLAADVTVERIPYYETSNVSGGYTAIIGD